MPTDRSKDSTGCEEYRPVQDLSHLQALSGNLPYVIMILLGATIFFVGIRTSPSRWIAAALYVLYGIGGAFWIMIFLCPYCQHHGTRSCPCGYGQIAAKLRGKKGGADFRAKFKRHIPVVVPLWVIPVLAGGIFLTRAFSWVTLTLMLVFAIDAFVLLPLTSRRCGCTPCVQKEDCPWTGRK